MTRVLGSYLWATRHPWASLLFLLPLLITYEGGVFWLGGSQPESLRNGADTWLRWGLEAFGFTQFYCAPALIAAVFLIRSWLCWLDRPEDPLTTWLGMAVESVAFAVGLYALSREVAPILKSLSIRLAIDSPWQPMLARSVTFVGAGIYEEAIFRLALFWLLNSFFGLCGMAWPIRVVLTTATSAIVFAAAHHIGPYGEPLQRFVFCFRTFAGLYFGLIYQVRGFGVAVGAHAGYDVLVGVLLT